MSFAELPHPSTQVRKAKTKFENMAERQRCLNIREVPSLRSCTASVNASTIPTLQDLGRHVLQAPSHAIRTSESIFFKMSEKEAPQGAQSPVNDHHPEHEKPPFRSVVGRGTSALVSCVPPIMLESRLRFECVSRNN